MIYEVRQTRSAAMAPLSNEQKQKLAAMAHYAYIEMGPDEDFDEWRHDEVRRVVGKAGLRQCVNADYNPLKARWLEMTGRIDAAFAAALKHANEPRQWAMFHLMKAATDAKDVMPEAMKYARGFVLNKRGIALEDADDKTIWHAVFTVRRKAQSLRKKKRGGESAADVLGKVLGYSNLGGNGANGSHGTDGRKAAMRRVRTTEGPF